MNPLLRRGWFDRFVMAALTPHADAAGEAEGEGGSQKDREDSAGDGGVQGVHARESSRNSVPGVSR